MTDRTKPVANSSKDLCDVLANDPYLEPYREIIQRRIDRFRTLDQDIDNAPQGLDGFSSGHEYFGLHLKNGELIIREWAPNAQKIYLIGNFTDWHTDERFLLHRLNDHGIWEIRLPAGLINHGDYYKFDVHWPGGHGNRIPSYARRVVQDEQTKIFSAQVWLPPSAYTWKHPDYRRPQVPPIIYEAHVGMAQEEGKVGTYREFQDHVLPRIIASGYNTVQLMAIQEHPYYGSFGYHVSNYFAPSSRFGLPNELKELIDAAHDAGIAVIIDLVHSHSVKNEVEGLGRFDGTDYQYFHQGDRGYHLAWDSRCFDYGKKEVVHFLLSNCRYWLDEFHIDGFRFDGVTSMLYRHHGLGTAFTSYDDYFGDAVDEDGLRYLALANKLIHRLRPDAITIAEDVSGMPGIGLPPEVGGLGFDYRLGMGIPDYWIKLVKDQRDEDWHVGGLWHELSNRRRDEKTIAYSESHDQALVGDQTLIFRLIGKDMYDYMHADVRSHKVDRGVALHKMIRLLTIAAGGDGYLNFMGNEFGHPEWIDFPREGNNWSYHYARRQWHLLDNSELVYQKLGHFDREMIKLIKKYDVLGTPSQTLIVDNNADHVLAFSRADLLFIFNFDASRSFTDYRINTPPGNYRLILDSDHPDYGGHDRLTPDQLFTTTAGESGNAVSPHIFAYLPTRTAIVLANVD